MIGDVYRAMAPPDSTLADLRRFSAGESEVLVRTELLRDVSGVEMDFKKAPAELVQAGAAHRRGGARAGPGLRLSGSAGP